MIDSVERYVDSITSIKINIAFGGSTSCSFVVG